MLKIESWVSFASTKNSYSVSMFQLSYRPEMMLKLLQPLFSLFYIRKHMLPQLVWQKKKKKKHLLRFPLKHLCS